MNPTPLKTADLQTTLEKPGLVLIDLWAQWCAPCRAFAPIYDRVAAKHPDVTFAKVNVDEEPAVAQAFGVRGIPALVAFRDGIPLFSQAGMVPEAALDALVAELKSLDMNEVRRQLAQAEATDRSADPSR